MFIRKDHLPMLQYQSTSVIRTHWNEEDYIQQMESFVAGLYLESQAGRHLLHYFVKLVYITDKQCLGL